MHLVSLKFCYYGYLCCCTLKDCYFVSQSVPVVYVGEGEGGEGGGGGSGVLPFQFNNINRLLRLHLK